MVDLYELKQLAAFAELGTLSRVAEKFHLSTPSVTRSMQHLEAYFGVPLFRRGKTASSSTTRAVSRSPTPRSSSARRRTPSGRSGPTTSGSGPSW